MNTVDKIEQFGDALFDTMHDMNFKTAKYFVLEDFNLDLMNTVVRKLIDSLEQF